MKNRNYSRRILRFAVACVVCVCALTGENIFGQSQPTRSDSRGKTGTRSECVNSETRQGRAVFVLVNAETPKCKQAIDSLKAGAVLIGGWGKDGEDMTHGLGLWLIEIASNPTWKSKFDEGLTLPNALKFFKENLAKESDDALKLFVTKIIKEVYGRTAERAEFDYYLPRLHAQQETYTSMLLAESNKLNKNAGTRKLMIDRAYEYSMGRSPLNGDYKYWQPRKEVFGEIVDASRKWLYSANGADDLWKTIMRAAQTFGTTLKPDEVNSWSQKFSQNKFVYWDMLQAFRK